MRIAVFSATRGKKEQTLLYKTWNQQGIDLHFKENNTEGLSKCYNEFMQQNQDVYDIITFIHDDVRILETGIDEKLIEAHAKYDIVGLAGCINPRIVAPTLWHLMCGGFQSGNTRGCVAHAVGKDKIHMSSYGVTPDRVVMIDGLFMSVLVAATKRTTWKFNEHYDWHLYDLSSCLDANKLGQHIGVWPIFVCHESPGLLSTENLTFQRNQAQFLKEYGSR